jgi:hypothetical protein
MADDKRFIKFIHKDGRVIPLVNGQNTPILSEAKRYANRKVAQVKTIGRAAHKTLDTAKTHVESGLSKIGIGPQPVHVRKGLDALGLGLSVASGVVGAATFSRPTKGFLGGFVAGHALDVVSTAANVASVAGRGNRKERLKQAGRQELRNIVVGNAVYVAGLVGMKSNRTRINSIARGIVNFSKKAKAVKAMVPI